MSNDERDVQSTGEENTRPGSSSSSVVSRSSSPDHVFVDKQEALREEDPGKLSADVAARGILQQESVSGPVTQSGMRGMLVAASELGTDNSENSQPADESPTQYTHEQLMNQGQEAEEDLEQTSGEMYFFTQESITRPPSTPKGLARPKKQSGTHATGKFGRDKSRKIQSSNEQKISKDAEPTPSKTNPASQGAEFFNKDSPTSRPWSGSSTSSAEVEREKILGREKTPRSPELVSVCTQTEWSWFNDMLWYQEMMARAEKTGRRASREVLKSPSAHSLASSVKTRRKRSVGSRRTSVSSEKAVQMKDEDNSSLPDVEEGREVKSSLAGFEEGSTGRSKSKSSGGGPRSRQSFTSSLPRTPKGDVLFRPTTVEPDSSSDSEGYENYDLDLGREYLLPSIGPPTILQYLKESQHPPLSNEEVEDRQEFSKDEILKRSMFSGPCVFCHEDILPFPTIEELEKFTADQLYCCPQYERLVKFELAQRKDSGHMTDELIDIKPHAPYGTKAARRAAKERAAQRAREREMERQRAAGTNPLNFYALTRQMKTITYSLASTKCMEEGWTVRPESPSSTDMEHIQDPFVIEVNPLTLRKQAFLERFYDNKRRFLLLLPDGTGTCYYPSGNIAVMITATEKGKFTYIVFDDDEKDNESNPSKMLAIFKPSGHGTCYFRDGSIRLVLNPFFGVLLDNRGSRKKKWLWHNSNEHVHAPPFQPVTFMITKQLSIRCLSQNKTVLTFNHGKYTARFNVGAKLKAVAKAKPPTSRESYETHLAEVKQFVNIVLDRYQNAMRLPNYPRLDKIPLPLHLQRAKDAGKKARLQGSTPSSQRETTVIVN